ncbi:MAG: MoaD/ThiS family protein [Phycisphaerales bacterium]
MHCTVLLFAQLAESIGSDRLILQLPDGATIEHALNTLASQHEIIASMRDTLAVAIDDCYCARNTTLNDGDTLALIPPVSGG